MAFICDIIVNENFLSIVLKGELVDNLNSDKKIVNKIEEAIKSGVINSVVDLSKVKYISSDGISWLITLLTKFRNKGGELVLLKPSKHVAKLLIITKLNGIFEIFETKEEGVRFLNNIH